jgi:hypothetical protein
MTTVARPPVASGPAPSGGRPRHVRSRRVRWGDASLSALLVVQGLTQFVFLPLEAARVVTHVPFLVGRFTFGALSAVTLTRRAGVRAALLALLVVHCSISGEPAKSHA